LLTPELCTGEPHFGGELHSRLRNPSNESVELLTTRSTDRPQAQELRLLTTARIFHYGTTEYVFFQMKYNLLFYAFGNISHFCFHTMFLRVQDELKRLWLHRCYTTTRDIRPMVECEILHREYFVQVLQYFTTFSIRNFIQITISPKKFTLLICCITLSR
ncbi:hypothetical protein T11_9648, partial [Trichinella zimbabwensis]